MKIINLSFSNINSLAGFWSIDFTTPAFSDGLFVLTGPTGAGKTSVLDAICLALYGKTVREEQISKEHNEVMTRGTGQCHAEVTFEVEGVRYRSRWSQDRAHKKPGESLQNAKREIANVATGEILASQLRSVDAKILEVTGMSFDQFTRAVLLAQGQFDTFIRAENNERADILEKITNTGEFSHIGAVAFARFQEEKRKKEDLENAQAAISVMTSEDRRLLDAQLADIRKRHAENMAGLETLSVQLRWLETIAALKKAQDGIVAERMGLEARRADSRPDLDKLAIAESARKLNLDWVALENDRTAFRHAAGELDVRVKQSNDSQKSQTAIAPRLAKSAELAEQTRQALENTLPKLVEIRRLDKMVHLAEQDRRNAANALATAEEQREEAAEAETEARSNQARAQADLDKANRYLQDHASDGTISTLLPPIETRYSSWELLKQNAINARNRADMLRSEAASAEKEAVAASFKAEADATAVATAKARIDAGTPRLLAARKARQDAEKNWREAEAAWKKQKPAFEKRIESAEEALRLAQQVANFEEARKQLADKCPCPLCGSTDHPYAVQSKPAIPMAARELKTIKGEMEQVESAAGNARDQYDKAVRDLQREEDYEKALKDDFKNAEMQASLSTQAAKTATATVVKTRKLADQANAEAGIEAEKSEKAWGDIAEGLVALAVPKPLAREWDSIIRKLKSRQTAHDAQSQLAQSADICIREAGKAITAGAQRLQSAVAAKTNCQTVLSQKTAIWDALVATRKAQYGELDPDEEESKLRDAKEESGKAHAGIIREKATLDQAALTALREVESAQELLQKVDAKFKATNAAFLVKCREVGFSDEAACRAACWTDQEFNRVTLLRKDLEKQDIELAARSRQNAGSLAAEVDKALTRQSVDELSGEIEAMKTEGERREAAIMELDFKVRTDDESRARQRAQGSALETQKAVFNRWDKMNDMIGTDGGARFKKYAQGITLSRLLKVANPHLASMTNGRYALLWDAKAGDELLPEVIDNHQAEARRPVSNLSGGETFMVSLALALGLSGMASGKLQVDSLFLDEGFGTLDNEALDRAIGTLNRLHQTHGKLIGVISHIDQLKNQISTKIEVTKVGNGRSVLSGPGVKGESTPTAPPSKEAPAKPADGSERNKRGRRKKVTLNVRTEDSNLTGDEAECL